MSTPRPSTPSSVDSLLSLGLSLESLQISYSKEPDLKTPSISELRDFSDVCERVTQVARALDIYQAVGVGRTMAKRFLTSLQESTTIEEFDKGIEKLPPLIKNLYEKHLLAKELSDRISQVANDYALISISAPVRAASQGVKALTLITDYTFGQISNRIGDIIKTAPEREALSNELYKAISHGFEKPRHDANGALLSYGIFVPTSSSVHLKNYSYEGNKVDPAQVDLLDQTVKNIALKLKKERGEYEHAPEVIMFQQKVPGTNFHDFVSNQYAGLSSTQRQALYERLGRLYEMDMWLGNNDRMGRVDLYDQGSMDDLENLFTNAANIMIQVDSSSIGVWAIDNELDVELINDPKKNEIYAEHLMRNRSSLTQITTTSKAVLKSLHETINEHVDMKSKIAVDGFSLLCKDLGKDSKDSTSKIDAIDAEKAFTSGRVKILKALKDQIIPSWNEGYMKELKNQLEQRYSSDLSQAMFNAISVRFQMFSVNLEGL